MPAVRDNQMVALRSQYGGTKALRDYLQTFTTDNPTFGGNGQYGFYTTALTAMGVSYPAGAALNDLAQTYWGIRASTPYTISGLVGWYDASVAAYITSGAIAAGFVDSWADLSGSNFKVTQTDVSTANHPQTGIDTINSLNVLKFQSGSILTKSGATIAQPLTVFVVTKYASHSGQVLGNGVNPEATLFYDGGVWSLYAGSVADTAITVDTATHQLSAIFNGASSKLYLDTIDISPSGNPGTGGRTTIALGNDTVGSGNAWYGDIAEVLIYNTALPAGNRATIEAYLRTKWGLHAFTPTDVTGLVGWWDASVAASITSSSGRVTALADQSSSGFTLSAAGGSSPVTGAHTQNSLNVIEFDGVVTTLDGAVSVTATNTMTMFAVLVPSRQSAFERFVSLTKGGDDYASADTIAAILRDNTNLGVAAFYNNSERGTKAMTNAAHVVVSQRNGDSHFMRVDGTAGTTVTGLGTTNFAFTHANIGGAFGSATPGYGATYVGEVLWYNAALSTSNIAMIENYLKAKWATP